MEVITVNKAELLEKLKENRNKHRQQFEKALAGWQDTVLEKLKSAVAEAEAGKRFRTSFHLPQPSDHTDEYDEIIAAVEWETSDEIRLGRSEFRQFVLDEWGWKRDFMLTSARYIDPSFLQDQQEELD